ncbi:hypothetical protein SprV_0100197000 [Sparganum proliferum]
MTEYQCHVKTTPLTAPGPLFTVYFALRSDVTVIKRLAITDGRNEKEFVRNLPTNLLGHPLCLAAIRENAAFSNCTVDTVRKSTIDWFHGTRDRYGGRSKRRDSDTKLPVSTCTDETYLTQSTSKDTSSPNQSQQWDLIFWLSRLAWPNKYRRELAVKQPGRPSSDLRPAPLSCR